MKEFDFVNGDIRFLFTSDELEIILKCSNKINGETKLWDVLQEMELYLEKNNLKFEKLKEKDEKLFKIMKKIYDNYPIY